MSNINKIKEKEDHLELLKVSFNSIFSSLLKYHNTSTDFLNAEAINKARRYGVNEYKRKYLLDSQGKISEFMRFYLFNKGLEDELTASYKILAKEIHKVELEIKGLKQENTNE